MNVDNGLLLGKLNQTVGALCPPFVCGQAGFTDPRLILPFTSRFCLYQRQTLQTAAPSKREEFPKFHLGALFNMSARALRSSVYLTATCLLLLVTVFVWSGCGGTSQSSSSAPSSANNPPAGGSQPGNSSSGASSNGSGGGNGGGSTGSSGATGGSGGSGSSGSAAYLYVGIDNTTGAIRGYKVDSHSASLAEVPGSPFTLQGSSTGVAVVSQHFVYGSEMSNGSAVVPEFRADANSGTLAQSGTLALPFTAQAGIFSEPSGHNLYAISGDILTLDINPDGTLTNSGSRVHIADSVGEIAISPNGQLAYAEISNGSFKAGTQTDGLFALNRNPSSGILTANHQVNSSQHLNGLQFDNSGRYLLAISGGGNQISVYSVDYSSGNLTPVPGSPFAVTRGSSVTNASDYTRTFRLDPSNRFLYTLNANPADPKPEYVSVFSFSEASGTLAQVQTLDMTAGTTPVALIADQSVVIAINTQSGFNPSNINVFRRDANTGMLTVGGSPVTLREALGLIAGEMHF